MDISTEMIVIAVVAIIALGLGIGFFVTSRFKTLNAIFLIIVCILIAFLFGIPSSPVDDDNRLTLIIIPIVLFAIVNKSRSDTEVARLRVGRRVFTAYVVHSIILIVSIFACLWIYGYMAIST